MPAAASPKQDTAPRLPFPRLAGAFACSPQSGGPQPGVPQPGGDSQQGGPQPGGDSQQGVPQPGGIAYLTDEALFESCGVRICFSARTGGRSEGPYSSLNLSDAVGDDPTAVAANRTALLSAVGLDGSAAPLVPKQVHSDEVIVLGPTDDLESARARAQKGADAVVCPRSGCPVLLCFADCVPVILVAPTGAFAVVHAGWRGAYTGIAAKSLRILAERGGCDPSACNAYIGPHIGPCCYEVSDDLMQNFVSAFGPSCKAENGHLDLSAAVTSQLNSSGADAARIADAGICTSCSTDSYFSYRAQGGLCGRHGALACLEA